MEKCQCPQSGFCPYFKQTMTYDPPNWQWCQDTSPEERLKYKRSVDKKHARTNMEGVTGRFITTADLVSDCRDFLVPQLYEAGITGVAPVPRSGYVAAGVCATALNIPIYNISGEGVVLAAASSKFGGYRMKDYSVKNARIAIIEDTVFSGHSIRKIKKSLRDSYTYGCVYSRPSSVAEIDYCGLELENPHILDWHFFNSSHMKDAILDFDGILSPDVPIGVCHDEEKYIRYLEDVKPIHHRLPTTHMCKGIVTARLEKYRGVTEAWLEKYKVKYGFLHMYPTEDEHIRDSNHIAQASAYKAEFYSKSDAIFFVESSPAETNLIRKIANKIVICPEQGKFG